jgi:hypothetical protein
LNSPSSLGPATQFEKNFRLSQSRPVVPARWPRLTRSLAALKRRISSSIILIFSSSCSIFEFFWRIRAAQLIEHFANGELSYFSHRNLLCAWENLLATTSKHFDIAQFDIAQKALLILSCTQAKISVCGTEPTCRCSCRMSAVERPDV